MIKFNTARKAIAILANVSLLFNSFVPFLLVAQPAYAQSSEMVVPTIEYSQSTNKLNTIVNTSEKVAYQLFYKTDKIDAIAGNDLTQADFYLGTCSSNSCLPQNISRGILKTESNSKFYSQFFTLENNVLTITKESESSQSDLTKEENDFLNDSILGATTEWTFKNVELNKEYVAPQNNGVKLTFTKLPENSGNIKIQEITLSKEQIEQSGSLSDKAYDITSDMVDGTFAYNLSLPIPESSKGQNVDIKFAEEISQIDSAETAGNTTETSSTISAANLDHFTIFVVAGVTAPSCAGASITTSTGDTCYLTIQDAINAANIGDTIKVAPGIYKEDVVINKSVILLGANADISYGSTNRINESKIIPKTDGVAPISLGTGIGTTNVTINGFEITATGSENAIMCGNSGASNLTIKYNYIHNIGTERGSQNVYAINYRVAGSADNVVITDNYIENILNTNLSSNGKGSSAAIWFGQSNATGMVTNVHIERNTITNVYSNLNQKTPDGTYGDVGNITSSGIYIGAGWKSTGGLSNAVIKDNTITNITGGFAYGIQLSGNTPGVEITGNAINGITSPNIPQYAYDIGVLSTNHGTGIKINNNSLKGDLYGVWNSSTNLIDATKNWWNHSTGPNDSKTLPETPNYNNSTGQGTKVTSYVDYKPWCTNSSCIFALSAPTNLTPANNTYTSNTSFNNTWTAVTDAVGYEYQTSYSSNGSSLGTIIYSDSSATLPGRYNLTGSTVTRTNSGTPNATYYWQVRAIDADGNAGAWSVIYKVTVDTIVPVITLGAYTTAPTNQNITVTAITDKGTLNVGSTTFTSNGSFTFTATDSAGNSASKTVTITNIDKTAPNVPQLLSPSNNAFINYNDFWFDWTDVGDAVSYEMQNSTNSAIDSNGSFVNVMWTGDYQKIQPIASTARSVGANGTWYWQVRAVDAAGNKSAWTTPWQINIDQIAPSTPTGIYYKDTVNNKIVNCGDKTNTKHLDVYWNANTEPDFDHYEYISYNADGSTGPIRTFTDNYFNASWWTIPSEGTYGVQIRAVDKAGNKSDWFGGSQNSANSCKYVVDWTAPEITINPYSTDPTNQNITVTATTNKGTLNVGSTTFTANGSFDFVATDSAGNVTTKTVTINNIDKEKPTIPASIDFKNPNLSCGSITNQKTITIDWSDSSDNVGVVGYDYSVDYPNGTTRGVWNTSFTQSQYTGSLNEGIHYIKVRAKDAAGNVSDWTNLCSITYDSIAPVSTITTPIDSSYFNKSININGNTTDLNGVASVNLSSAPYVNGVCSDTYSPITTITGDSSKSFSWSYGWTPTTEGNYCLKAAGTDVAGNAEHSAIVKNIVFDKTLPQVSISLNPTVGDASNGWYKTQPEATLTITDDNYQKIDYQWDSQIGTWITSTSTTLSTKPSTEGVHVLYYQAWDKAGNKTEVGIKNINWDQTDLEYGPQNITANPNPTSGSTSKIKWEFAKDNTGIDKYEIQWKLNDNTYYSKTVGAGTTEVEIDNLTEGRWTVKVIAFDQSGKTKDNSIDVIVDQTGPTAPVLTLTGTGTGTATLSWNAIDDAKDYIIWYGSVQGVHQFGARVGNVTSYTVKGLGAGNYYFIIKAVDEAQNQSADSNEINTGTITGAVGTTPGQPAEGFTPEVLGATTEEINPEKKSSTEDKIDVGNVLGISTEKGFNWWWLSLLLLIIPLYIGGKKISKKRK